MIDFNNLPAKEKIYYQDESVVIYNADCREILPQIPDKSIDLVLTDPPYGINLNTDNSRFSGGTAGNMAKRGNGVGTAKGQPIVNDDKPFDPTFLLNYGDSQIIWGWNHFADKLPHGSCLVWVKRYDEAFGSFLSDAELAWMSKGYGVYCKRDLSNNAIANNRVHPTQKPVTLMAWCLSFFPDANTILDPFLGSGTTAYCAKKLGRKCIGIEIEEKYCEIAAKRCMQTVMQFEETKPDVEKTAPRLI